MRMVKNECKQDIASPPLHPRIVDVACASRRPKEQKTKTQASTPNRLSAQQFRDMRRAERLRGRPFAGPRQ